MVTMPQSTSRTAHLLALMKKGDDAFYARDIHGMNAVHHPDMIANVTGHAEPIRGRPAHSEVISSLKSAFIGTLLCRRSRSASGNQMGRRIGCLGNRSVVRQVR